MTIRAYATYMVAVLLFVGQLEAIPTDFDDIEARACRRLFVGPYRWILPEVLKQLKAMHFPVELKCAKTLSVVARSRVLRMENRQHGGLRCVSASGSVAYRQLWTDATTLVGHGLNNGCQTCHSITWCELMT